MGELEGKVTIITGGGSGIGAGIARVVAREGAKAVVTDLDGDDFGPEPDYPVLWVSTGRLARRSAR